MDAIVLKTYDDLGNMIGASSCTDDADLERAKEACLKMTNGLIHVNFEVIRNPEEKDVADIKEKLEAQGQYVEAVKAEEAYGEICKEYDNGNIGVTEAINRINALYPEEEAREYKIAELLNGQDARLNGEDNEDCDCDCDECQCTEDDLQEAEDDSYQA